VSAGIVIVGAGHAGTSAAVTLRAEGWSGPVTLVGGEAFHPYERPPLSKAFMLSQHEQPGVHIVSEGWFAANGVAHLRGTAAMAVDLAARTVRLADGGSLAYAQLLLCTGARPRRLPVKGDAADAVLYLRSFGDALALRGRLAGGGHLLVVGGGFIGLEIAASARAKGCPVTIVEAGPRLLTRGVPESIARRVAARHEAEGVRVICGAGLTAVNRDGGSLCVTLADGTQIDCDAIVAGVGAIPETGLAEEAGLAIDNGIAVNASLRTSDPHVFAAGDCCSFPHLLLGGRRIRLEAWRNAQDQGATAARAMLGREVTYDVVPWFWSDQYDLTIQVAGLPDEAARIVTRPLADGVDLNFHLAHDGRLVAASAFGPNGLIGREVRLAEMLIARSARPDPDALASPQVRLKSLLA
jgi:3-phenylpropionate/trans-cinnamate dioxygenase ferredoxin reductase subunit